MYNDVEKYDSKIRLEIDVCVGSQIPISVVTRDVMSMVRWVSSLLPGQRLMSDRSRSQNLFARRRKSLGNPAGSSSSEAGAVDRSFTREASGVGTGSVFTVGIAGPSGGGK